MVDWDLVNTGYDDDNEDYNSSERAGDREDGDLIRGLTLRGQIIYARASLVAKHKTCRKCGTNGLTWKQHDTGNWWLSNADGSWHTCPENKP